MKARYGGIAGGLAVVLTSIALLQALPAWAQETPDQFNAANAESRRHSDAQNQLRNQEHDLRIDQDRALLNCQGAGSAAAQGACNSNVGIDQRQRSLNLNNQFIQEHDTHNQILKGIGVHRAP